MIKLIPKVNQAEDTKFRVLRLLEENPELTQRQIAEQVGVSLGGINYCLQALVDKGFLKIQNFQNSENKIGYVYFLTPKGIYEKSKLTANFLSRKMQEFEALKAEIDALQADLDKD